MMNKKRLLVLTSFIALALSSCGNDENKNTATDTSVSEKTVSQNNIKTDVALSFINAYVDYSNRQDKAATLVDWNESNRLTTAAFKADLRRIIKESTDQDSESGPEADPLFDAQDYPEKGFEVESIDEKTNFLIVKGKDWPEFKLTMKVIEENGKWLVDGCGSVNIPGR